jgi:(2Fe-2S) ferredoxin
MAYRANILISNDASGSSEVQAALLGKLQALDLDNEIGVLEASALGTPAQGVSLVVYPDGVNYVNVTPEDAQTIVEEHLYKGRIVDRLVAAEPSVAPLPEPSTKEVRVVLRNVGKINPESIDDYIIEDGYQAMGKVLTEMTPEQVIDVLKQSGLRGRGASHPAVSVPAECWTS